MHDRCKWCIALSHVAHRWFWFLIAAAVGVRFMSKHNVESDEAFDARYEAFFNRKDIDGWECRKVWFWNSEK